MCYSIKGQSRLIAIGGLLPRERTMLAVQRFPAPPPWIVPESLRALSLVSAAVLFALRFALQFKRKTSPLRIHHCAFDALVSSETRIGYLRRFARCRRGFVLQTVTSFPRPRLLHYYGFICHLTSRRRFLELPLEISLLASHASPLGELTRLR